MFVFVAAGVRKAAAPSSFDVDAHHVIDVVVVLKVGSYTLYGQSQNSFATVSGNLPLTFRTDVKLRTLLKFPAILLLFLAQSNAGCPSISMRACPIHPHPISLEFWQYVNKFPCMTTFLFKKVVLNISAHSEKALKNLLSVTSARAYYF